MHPSIHCLLTAVLLANGLALAESAKPGDELLQNGNFEAKTPNSDLPDGWRVQGPVRWAAEGNNHWVIEDAPQPATLSLNQRVPMGASFWKLRLSCRVKVTGVKLGQEGWNNARLAMCFYGPDGKKAGGWPNVLNFTGTMADWERHERDFVVPEGAASLEMSCSLFSTTGKVEWDDVSLKLLKFKPVLEDAALPPKVEARWELGNAFREETPARGRFCINGLWKFHAGEVDKPAIPSAGSGWGWLKVPGSWHAPTARMRPILPDFLEGKLDLGRIDAAWYQRTITVPKEWTGRRILVELDNPKQTARVFVDSRDAGTVEWPGGRVDITQLVKPGGTQTLSIHVAALPTQDENLVVMGPEQMEKARSEMKYKGLAGDCFLVSEPTGPRIEDVFVKPSVRRGELAVQCELSNAPAGCRLEAVVRDGDKVVKTFGGKPPLIAGAWPDAKKWDLDQPNLYHLSVRLTGPDGKLLDETTPLTFGFREFWIKGRNFYLNGSPIHLRCLDLSNPGDFSLAARAQVRTAFTRARDLGFNYVIHSNYDYEPQSFAYMDDTLRAGDEAGFPMSYTIRHVKRIASDFENPEKRKLWNRVVDYEVKRVRNHPSVLMWAMNHNFCGWPDDQNPARLDGISEPPADSDPRRTQRRAAASQAERYVMGLDGTRPAYHHESGNLNQMITLNCYLNWTPLQERIEWVSHWAESGVKPLFFVEFGLPHHASWGGHRTGPFIWRNKVNSEPLAAEFSAMYNGDEAFHLADYEISHIAKIEKIYARSEPFHITEVLGDYWNKRWEHNFLEIKSAFTEQTWPAFRTWGVTAILPWDQGDFFKQSADANPQAVELATDWLRLQQPGLAPDFVPWSDDWLTTPKLEGNLEETSLAKTFRRVNRETLAWIGGPPERFTAKDHIYAAGETVTKQVALVNDLRRAVSATWEWKVTLDGRSVANGKGEANIPAGEKKLVPFRFQLPEVDKDSKALIALRATLDGKGGANLTDSVSLEVLPKAPALKGSVACYDPKGLTTRLLRDQGVTVRECDAPVPPRDCKLFVIGREAITSEGPEIDLTKFLRSDGSRANLLIFEQTEEVLQKRWGFRTASPGSRRVFVRQPVHPVCRGLSDDLLRDWRGSSSLLEAYPNPIGFRSGYPAQEWCGFKNTRTWQWGNYGTVASVVMEKPQIGNWSTILDCEFDLQYSPLLEWLPPVGRVIFSQIDFSGRNAADPAANRLLANLLSYAESTRNREFGEARILGDGLPHMSTRKTQAGDTLIVTKGADLNAAKAAAIDASTVVCLGLNGEALSQVLPFPVQTEDRAVTHSAIGRPTEGLLAGLGDGDFHWRGRIELPAITKAPSELHVLSTGVYAEGYIDGKRYVLVQFTPAQFNPNNKPYLRLSRRHALISIGRILTNCGVEMGAPVASLLGTHRDSLFKIPRQAPAETDMPGRWLKSYYLDEPTSLDDPYRYERW